MPDGRRDADYLEDLCEAMCRIQHYTSALSYEGFLRETIVQDAVVRNLTIIGEATKRLSVALRRAHPEIPWRNMAGMRDRLTHDYFGINYDIAWTVAHGEVPMLHPQLEKLLTEAQSPLRETQDGQT